MSELLPSLDKAKFSEYKKTEKTIVIDFWADWCAPCRVMTPVFEEVSKLSEFSDVEFLSCDTMANPELTEEFGVMGIPAFIVVKFNGDESASIADIKVNEITGSMPKEKFVEALNEILKSAK